MFFRVITSIIKTYIASVFALLMVHLRLSTKVVISEMVLLFRSLNSIYMFY